MTPQQTKKTLENLLSALSDTLNELGAVQTLQLLREGRGGFQKTDITTCADCVANVFEMPPNTLFSKSKKYPRKYAFAIWVYICYNDLKYSLPDLAAHSRRSVSAISKSKKLIDEHPNVTPFDKMIYDKLSIAQIKTKETLNNA